MNRREFLGISLGGFSATLQAGRQGASSSRKGEGSAEFLTAEKLQSLPETAIEQVRPPAGDWLVTPYQVATAVSRTAHPGELSMSNGLIRRVWRLQPNGATVAFDNLMTGAAILRGVKPEAYVVLNSQKYAVGGLVGQPDFAYLKPEWLDQMTADPKAFVCTGFRAGKTRARFPWKRSRFSGRQAWPPPGASLVFRYVGSRGTLSGVSVDVHYEMFDGLPLLSKWLCVHNGADAPIRLNGFSNEILAAVEYQSSVNSGLWRHPNFHVESDYEFGGGIGSETCNHTVHWLPDPDYTTQVNYSLQTPCLLEVYPPLGPDLDLPAGGTFESYRTYELVYDSTDRERQGLALQRMYRTIAPWVSENPIFMHVTSSKASAVRSAIRQAADVGFEMVILSFGSGFDPENEDPAYLREIKALVDYAGTKGIVLGGYSLLASRDISPQDDVINPKTGTTAGAIFGHSPCLGSRWGIEYFRKLRSFFEKTGMGVLEHDGSYPGDVCASTHHPGHRGLLDSQWTQWKEITAFYHWMRARGVYLNVPDWYFLNGSNKTGMGYRETDWSLARAQQVIIGRQNIFDGTWVKTPSMGWMFVPLLQYHGGGAAATLEPLREHLHVYAQILGQNFGSGVQAAYRGLRLYDSEETREVVRKWVSFYKAHRPILDSPLIHVRRADARDLDCILHVNAQLDEKGLAMVYNPLSTTVSRRLRLPLYYTGLTRAARVREREGRAREYRLNGQFEIEVPVTVSGGGLTWLVIE